VSVYTDVLRDCFNNIFNRPNDLSDAKTTASKKPTFRPEKSQLNYTKKSNHVILQLSLFLSAATAVDLPSCFDSAKTPMKMRRKTRKLARWNKTKYIQYKQHYIKQQYPH